MRIYLDNCCFNRPFDNQNQLKIQLETKAKLHIQDLIKKGMYELVWSFMLDFENGLNPYPDKKDAIQKWEDIAKYYCKPSVEINQLSKEILSLNIRKKDSLQIACAIVSNATYFITTDKGLLNKNKEVQGITIISPQEFISEMEV